MTFPKSSNDCFTLRKIQPTLGLSNRMITDSLTHPSYLGSQTASFGKLIPGESSIPPMPRDFIIPMLLVLSILCRHHLQNRK
jgi:hypothetical protein